MIDYFKQVLYFLFDFGINQQSCSVVSGLSVEHQLFDFGINQQSCSVVSGLSVEHQLFDFGINQQSCSVVSGLSVEHQMKSYFIIRWLMGPYNLFNFMRFHFSFQLKRLHLKWYYLRRRLNFKRIKLVKNFLLLKDWLVHSKLSSIFQLLN